MSNITSCITEVWEQEQLPEDWRRGLIVKLAKKGDITECGNWRGITQMQQMEVAAKFLGRVILTRIPDGVNDKLRQEQADFRKGRGTVEQIFILRNIIEQLNGTPTFMCALLILRKRLIAWTWPHYGGS